MKLSVVIVSYNVRYYLEQCLRSVERALVGMDAEVWVVDNDSSDDSVAYLQARFPDVQFIANSENVGFSRANNIAIRRSKGEYVLLLNPDTLVAEHTIGECVAFLDSHPDDGAVGVRMLNADGSFAPESRRGLPTPFTSFCKMTGLAALFPRSRVFGRYYMRYLNPDEPNPIEVISGAFFMVRRDALDQVGLLDEDFFMYGEDIDLSYRLLKGGWQNWYLPLDILHYMGESTAKGSFRYVHVFYNAMLIFFNKHYYSRPLFFLGWIVHLAVILRAIMDLCLRFWYQLRVFLHCPPSSPEPSYVRFDMDEQPVSAILQALRSQRKGHRRELEMVSHSSHVLIHMGGVINISH